MAENAAKLLPNIRKLFVPDPGHVILDVDLSGADAQVVAWEAEDEDLKAAFKAGLKIHHKNAADMWGDRYTKLDPESHQKKQLYSAIKKAVHGTNYISSAKNIAVTLGWKVQEAVEFQAKWFSLHPGIRDWHDRTQLSLERSRSVVNKFGFRIYYFDRIDSVLPEAIAWVPQSTVANTCFRGLLQVRERLPWVQILLQVHDSGVLQIPKRRMKDVMLIRQALFNPVPYPDPLTIPWGISVSDRSWGDVKEVTWEKAETLQF